MRCKITKKQRNHLIVMYQKLSYLLHPRHSEPVFDAVLKMFEGRMLVFYIFLLARRSQPKGRKKGNHFI